MECGGNISDEVLIVRCAEGDRQAFGSIVARYRDKMHQFVIWFTESQNAEDLTQDIFVEVFRSAGTFQGRSSFRTWLYAIARNVCRADSRARRIRGTVSIEQDLFNEPLLDKSAEPFEMVGILEVRQALQQAMSNLPPDQRVTLMLKDWEALSYAEIAQVLDIPIGTVRSRLHNARATLAQKLVRFSRCD